MRPSDVQPGPLDQASWDDLPTVEPPAGFADDVLAASANTRRPRRWRRPAAVAAALAAAAALVLVVARGGERRGAATFASRRTVALGDRGVAVGEAGAALSWRVRRSGAAEVDHTDGEVFYRVERGAAFVVRTPLGDVTVTGTCFRVEVRKMKLENRLVVAAGAGALVAASVVVTLYEGGVRVSNAQGTVQLAPGERAVVVGGEAPQAGPPASGAVGTAVGSASAVARAPATAEEMAARYEAQERELREVRARLRAFEEKEAAEQARRQGANSVEPSPEALQDWAKSCQVPIPFVPFLNDELNPGAAATTLRAAELSEDEVKLAMEAGERLREEANERLRSIYVEATGRKDLADGMSFVGMLLELYAKAPPGEGTEVRRRISSERAGLAAPAGAAPQSPLERAFRYALGLHERFERELARELGPEKAHAINRNTSGRENISLGAGCR